MAAAAVAQPSAHQSQSLHRDFLTQQMSKLSRAEGQRARRAKLPEGQRPGHGAPSCTQDSVRTVVGADDGRAVVQGAGVSATRVGANARGQLAEVVQVGDVYDVLEPAGRARTARVRPCQFAGPGRTPAARVRPCQFAECAPVSSPPVPVGRSAEDSLSLSLSLATVSAPPCRRGAWARMAPRPAIVHF